MRVVQMTAIVVVLGFVAGTDGAQAQFRKCRKDQVKAGSTCIDTYEASVWRIPNATTTNKKLVKKVQKGKATAADLAAGGATPLGLAGDDYGACSDDGSGCTDVYAVSLQGMMPSAWLTQFQALAACRNSAKELPRNIAWQAAALGTQDPGPDNGTTDCNTASSFVTPRLPVGNISGQIPRGAGSAPDSPWRRASRPP